MLRRFASKAVLCYDPDAAGQSAAERSCELLVGEGFDVNVALLPRRRRSRYLSSSGTGARHMFGELRQIAAVSRVPARSRGRRARPDAGRCPPRVPARRCSPSRPGFPIPATRDQFADRLAHKARVTEEVVRAEIRKAAAAERPSCRSIALGRCLDRSATSKRACCGRWCTRPGTSSAVLGTA